MSRAGTLLASAGVRIHVLHGLPGFGSMIPPERQGPLSASPAYSVNPANRVAAV